MFRAVSAFACTRVTTAASVSRTIPALRRLISTTERDTVEDNETTNFRFAGGRTKQLNPNPAQDLVNEIPPIECDGRIVACNGGGGALGHPKIFINLDNPEPARCTYCGVRYVQKHHH
eukprot:CFRG0736T1